jgi:hypothetical protein
MMKKALYNLLLAGQPIPADEFSEADIREAIVKVAAMAEQLECFTWRNYEN